MDVDDIRRKVAMLRAKTVANGASPGEAQNAADKADELERRYHLRPEPAERRAASLVILTPEQHRALRRGETITVMRRAEPHRYRLDGQALIRWTPAAGEVRHDLISVQPTCRNVVVRFA